MSKFRIGDRVRVVRDTEYDECKQTGIWHFPPQQGRKLIGKVGTIDVEGCHVQGGQTEWYVHLDGYADNVIMMIDERDLEKI